MCKEVDASSDKRRKHKSAPRKEATASVSGDSKVEVQEKAVKGEQQTAPQVTPLPLSVPTDQQSKIIKLEPMKDESESSSVDLDLSAPSTSTT